MNARSSADAVAAAPPAGRPGDWESLRLLNSYRLFVAVALLAGFLAALPAVPFGRTAPQAFYVFMASYLVLALLFALTIRARRPPADTQAYLHFYTDVIALSGAMYASGGVASGLGILLAVPVAGAGILLPLRHALVYAALSTLLVLTAEVVRHFQLGPVATAYPQAALLGAILFVVAILATLLARRGAQTAALAEQRSRALRRMSELNERIVQQMESGILVVAPDGTVTLANASADQLLAAGQAVTGQALESVAPGVAQALYAWRSQPRMPLGTVDPGTGADQRLQPQFTDLGEHGTLVSLEDAAFIEQQLQQLKLASLGRLTASIAHEIRNPLGAISHSAQLLAESADDDAGERRLVEIQLEHCRRINDIVENILQLSRRKAGSPTSLRLGDWLAGFADEFRATHGLDGERVRTGSDGAGLEPVLFDPEHLRQVVGNLCENSLKHGRTPDDGPVRITLETGAAAGGQPHLDIVDDGVPIEPQRIDEIFEPFYTTSHAGTGLGLYLARELCEANYAELRYISGGTGNRFRIQFQTTVAEGAAHG